MTSKLKLHVTQLPYLDAAQLFEMVADEPWAMFFDSGPSGLIGSESARYDILAMAPKATLVFDGEASKFKMGTIEQNLFGDPMEILKSAIPECEKPKKTTYLPGAYGYFSYDLARQYEALPNLADDEENLPHMAMGIYYVVLVIDQKRRISRVIRMGESDHAKELERRWLDLILRYQEGLVALEIELMDELPSKAQPTMRPTLGGRNLRESLDWEQYQLAFATVRQYTKNGDCYQVNLTKQFSADVNGNAWQVYQALRKQSPAPYGCYMNLPFAQVLSNSPESFIKCRAGAVVTSPIKGTRARDHSDFNADKAIAESLRVSEKDRAENLMIVDLMRNDLSRACEGGSVEVPELFVLHSFANVHHLISKVVGKLREDLHSLDLLRCCFPGGSITGAPKIRSMEIIEELEPKRRGIYCGAIGYIGADGDMETNIAIRTIVVKDGVARFSAGGGLVVDSDVEGEYQELNDKVSMLMPAVVALN